MVPHWDYSSSTLSDFRDREIPGPDSQAPSTDRLQRRSRSASAHHNHLVKQQFDDGGSLGHMPLRHQLGIEDATADHRENPWISPVYRGERRPDYIVKADEDSFIVLGELERRLRVAPRRLTYWGCESLFVLAD